jgi:hypothetical protein
VPLVGMSTSVPSQKNHIGTKWIAPSSERVASVAINGAASSSPASAVLRTSLLSRRLPDTT